MPQALSLPYVIAGQGLAGTLLAWALLDLGQSILVLDEDAPFSSSKIAAGIVTPITGKRLALHPGTMESLQQAKNRYWEISRRLGTKHYHETGQVRLWQSEAEAAVFQAKRTRPEYLEHLAPGAGEPNVDGKCFRNGTPGMEMITSGWLDTRGWLRASADFLKARGLLRMERLDPASVEPHPEGVRLPGGVVARAVIFCEGAQARQNPWFPWVGWKCAKGEILDLHIPELAGEKRIFHQYGWLLPVDGTGRFRSGSTYTWDDPDPGPTEAAAILLKERLRRMLKTRFAVTGQQAAVRPIIHQSLVRMGRHPVHPQLVFFNGLGSKGVLHGPRHAALLAEHLVSAKPLPHAVDVAGNYG